MSRRRTVWSTVSGELFACPALSCRPCEMETCCPFFPRPTPPPPKPMKTSQLGRVTIWGANFRLVSAVPWCSRRHEESSPPSDVRGIQTEDNAPFAPGCDPLCPPPTTRISPHTHRRVSNENRNKTSSSFVFHCRHPGGGRSSQGLLICL